MAQKKRSNKAPRGAIGSDPFAEMDDGPAGVYDTEREVSLPSAKKADKTGSGKAKAASGPPAEVASVDDQADEAATAALSTEAATGDVVLPEVLMLPNAAEVSDQIADALARGEPFNIDAAALERVDTAGIQLLLAAVSQGRSQGLTVSLENASSMVRDKARILDLSAQLGLSEQRD